MLNISKQIHVAWDSANQKYELPEVSIAPVGESKKEKKKLETLAYNNTSFQDYDNIPLPGFTLYEVNKRKYSDYDSSWLVIDPRGFMARISSANMSNILKVSGITEGLVQQKCVWARQDEDTNLTLVPISSDQYKVAVKNTEIISQKVDMSQVQIGDTVLLQNELQGVYLGVMSLYGSASENPSGFKVLGKLRRQVIEVSPGNFHYGTDIKILKVIKKASIVLTREEAVSYVNSTINTNPNSFFTVRTDMKNYYYGVEDRIKFASVHAVPKVKIELVPITRAEADRLFDENYDKKDNGCLVVEDVAGVKYITHYPWLTSIYTDPKKFNTSEISTVMEDKLKLITISSRYYLSHTAPQHTVGQYRKFYKIVKTVKDKSYI